MSYTDFELVQDLQYVLMEPIDGLTFPSNLWTIAEVINRMNERQNRFLKATGLLLGSAVLPVAAGDTRIALPDDWLATVEVWFVGANGRKRELIRSDSFAADHGAPSWSTDFDTPIVYMDYDAPTLLVQIAPAPNQAGTLLLLYVPQGAPLGVDLANAPELLSVPDEFLSAVKYGTLADLFGKDGRGKDPTRAAYCEQRYQLAEQVAGIILNGWA